MTLEDALKVAESKPGKHVAPEVLSILAKEIRRLRDERYDYAARIVALKHELERYKEREATMGWNQS